MNRSPWMRLVRGGWLFAILSVMLGGVSWGLFGEAADRHDPLAEQRVLDNNRLIWARLEFERAGVGLLAERLMVGTGVSQGDPRATAALIDEIRQSYAVLEDLAAGDGSVAEIAATLVGAIDPSIAADPVGELTGLYDAVDDVRWAAGSMPLDSEYGALFELGFFVALPDHVLVEALAATGEADERSVDPEVQDLFDAVAVVVRSDGGWFGEDPAAPLTDSEWFDVENARSNFPAQTNQIEQMFASSGLVTFDTWMAEYDLTASPPIDIAEVMIAVEDLHGAVAEVADPLQVSETAAAVDRAERDAAARSDLQVAALVAGIAAALLALVAAVLLVIYRRSIRRLSELALRDALTGVSSRHALDTEVRVALADNRLEHHVVVIVDLDRFKMVNDAFGHAVGDALLREVAGRLRSTADTVGAATPNSVRSVVRMGGDEFLVTVHAPGEVRADLLTFELDAARRRPFEVTVDGRIETLLPEFSYGLAHADGRGDLDALISAADLAAYANKARRAVERREMGQESPRSEWNESQPG